MFNKSHGAFGGVDQEKSEQRDMPQVDVGTRVLVGVPITSIVDYIGCMRNRHS